MANTLSSSILLDALSDRVITTLGNKLAPLNAFSKDFSTDNMAQNTSVQVKKFSSTSAIQTNPSNFESGDTTGTNVNVLIKHYSKSFTLTSQELNSRYKLDQLADINLQVVANKIMDVALTPIDATNFPTNVTVAQTSFVAANVKTLWAAAAKSSVKNLVLDSVAYAQLLPTTMTDIGARSGYAGFDGVYLNTRWTGAGTNVYGFACGPEAIAVVGGIPMIDPTVAGLLAASKVITIEGLGLSVQINTWGSLSSRSAWASFDVMFGAALGDNTAVARCISA